MQVSSHHGHLHTNFPKLPNNSYDIRGRWVERAVWSQGVPEGLVVGKKSKQAKTRPKFVGQSLEANKGLQGGDSPVSGVEEASSCGSCSREQPSRITRPGTFVQCHKTGITVHKKLWNQNQRAGSEKHVCVDDHEKLQMISK